MTKRKTTKPEPTAAEMYAARRNDIARLLDVLSMHLDFNDKEHAAAPSNWGLVGNLGKVRSDLIDLVGFLSGMERERIEEFLRDVE